uniref:HotDog ACOT-type domain-containing protein n=1 Tax=Coccolithus braarudii TaxID=221442 RepID=A0A7S0L8R4_9EUKA|mmetsp:Transcript_21365/g.45881  ORF Transcript_21365/g.45881 Transcript_21365/m.45881 type:complete len:433 (+) Transcript_21365:1-1299(+)
MALNILTRKLRRPSNAFLGGPGDVASVLPALYGLSRGAKRGTPSWVPQPDCMTCGGGIQHERERTASWLEITYPFASDPELRLLYQLGDGNTMRAGMFLEELDAFSADCALRHCESHEALSHEALPGSTSKRHLTVVTAAHDGLALEPGVGLSALADLRLRGGVVSVGRTSMEVQTDLLRVIRFCPRAGELHSSDHEREEYIGSCFTVMVARELDHTASALVPRLAGGESDAGEVEAAVARNARRRQLAVTALALQPPSVEEVPVLHELWRRTRDGVSAEGVHVVPMQASEHRAVDIQQPVHRNNNGFMFGGYLMRRALEVAWLSAFRLCRQPPRFAGLDDVVFKKPVVVGSMLEYVARVAFVCPNGSIRVLVEAQQLDLCSGKTELTNQLHFVFESKSSGQMQVHPSTYEEGMVYLEGRRRWMHRSKRHKL